MPYGNFSRDQALIEEGGKYLLIGGPIDPDVKHVTEICAWIIQGLFDGNDAAATEMADIAGDAESRLLLFKNVATETATTTGATPVDGGSLESEWRLDDTGPKLRLIKTVVLENGQRGVVPLELVTPEDERPNEWRLLVERKGNAPFMASAPAVAVAIAKSETIEGMERVEQWAQTVNVMLVRDTAQKDLIGRLFPVVMEPVAV